MLLSFFQWMGDSALAKLILSAAWYSPILQGIHLLALATFAGSIVIVDLRLIGAGVKGRSAREIEREALPWLKGAFLTLFLTGVPQLFSLAMKEYYSPYFWYKMSGIAIGFTLMLTVRRRIVNAGDRANPLVAKAVGLFSMALWTSVAINARLIGLLG
jgi:hypothetical protein